MTRALVPIALLLVCPLASLAGNGPARMLRDINQTPAYVGGDPSVPVARDGLAYFTASDGFGRGLWRTDGTREGTLRLALLDPEVERIEVGPLLDGEVYIALLTSSPRTRQVWRSDGTPAGTGPATERPLDPVHVTAWNGITYFFDLSADPNDGGLRTLWRSDGGALTELSRTGNVNPPAPAGVGDWLLFEAWTQAHGSEVWRSDGTRQGTRRLLDLRPGAADSFPREFTRLGERVCFIAWDGRGDEVSTRLWCSDGTAAGTDPVSDQPFASARSMRAILGLLWIEDHARNEPMLWRSDGTAEGTFPLVEPRSSLIELDGAVYFLSDLPDGPVWPDRRAELLRSDGTVAGTTLVTTFRTSRTGYGCDWQPAVIDGALVFLLDNLFDCEPVRYTPGDGSLTKLMPPPVRDNPPAAEGLTALDGDRAVFIGDLPGLVEPQLWVTDGTADGTHLLHELFTATLGSRPGPLLAGDEGVLFTAQDAEHDRELWRSDGTPTGTMRISERFPDPFLPPSMAAVRGGAVLFDAGSASLWFAPYGDGQATSIARFPTFTGGGTSDVRAAGGRAYFRPERDALWVTDGTVAGTARVTTGVSPYLAEATAALGDVLFFVGEPYRPLWRTDGSTAGTWAVRETEISDVRELTAAAGVVVFRARSADGGEELWRSDGTDTGTWQLADLRPGREGSNPRNLTAVGSSVYFDADDGIVGRELWWTDGQQVTLVADVAPGPASAIRSDSSPNGQPTFHHRGILFFRAFGDEGTALWRSDGTAAGTFPLKPSTIARTFFTVHESVFFVDLGCAGGQGLWQADRGASAVRCLLRLDPPALFFNQSEFDGSSVAVSDGVLYFSAYDPRTGTEPWAVPVTALFCRGDADGDRRVTIDELVSGVSAALGPVDERTVASFDADGDGRVGIAELIAAVSAATLGCTTPYVPLRALW